MCVCAFARASSNSSHEGERDITEFLAKLYDFPLKAKCKTKLN